MIDLVKYIIESQESLWHFTNSVNLNSICKDDTFNLSSDDGRNPNGYEFYMSTSRQRNSLTGYPTQMLNPDIVRIELDERKLHSKFIIKSVSFTQSKQNALKSSWSNIEDFNRYHQDIMLQSNVECEDRILSKQPQIKQFHKYIKSIHLNNNTINPDYADNIIRYCDKWNIDCEIFTDDNRFSIGRVIEGKWYDRYHERRYKDPVKDAVWNYVSGYTTGINNVLRRRGRVDKDYIKLMDSAFVEKRKINVYRTVDWEYLRNIYNITENNLKDFIGQTISNKGYMSCSSLCKSPWGSKWLKDDVVLHICSSRPIPVIDVNKLFDSNEIDCADQEEIILPRNLEMQIKNYSNIDKTLFIEIEII